MCITNIIGYHGNNPDIDECVNSNGGCQHVCKNDIGGYQCLCNGGHTLGIDKHGCKGMCVDDISCF